MLQYLSRIEKPELFSGKELNLQRNSNVVLAVPNPLSNTEVKAEGV